MKSLNQKLIALAAAVLFTTFSLSAVNYNVGTQQTAATEIGGIKVTNLPAINVQPNAESRRSASLLSDIGVAAFAALPIDARHSSLEQATDAAQARPLGSQLAMPYYSFGNKFGRISKE